MWRTEPLGMTCSPDEEIHGCLDLGERFNVTGLADHPTVAWRFFSDVECASPEVERTKYTANCGALKQIAILQEDAMVFTVTAAINLIFFPIY